MSSRTSDPRIRSNQIRTMPLQEGSMESKAILSGHSITTKDGLGSRLSDLGIVLPVPPTPLGAYVESSDAGNLLFLSGMLPVVNGTLAVRDRLGDTLSVEDGREAARIAALNALAAAKQHLRDLDRLTTSSTGSSPCSRTAG